MLVPVRAIAALAVVVGLLIALMVPSLAAGTEAALGVVRGDGPADEARVPAPRPSAVPTPEASLEAVGEQASATPSEADPRRAGTATPTQAAAPAGDAWIVTYVVDGDTLDASRDGVTERVRVVGIDTPERGECGFDEATEALEEMVLGEGVELVPGAQDERDRYGRLLAYVDVIGGEPVDAGLSLISQGYAIARYDSRDGYGEHARESEYVAADLGAGSAAGCARATPTTSTTPAVAVDPPAATGSGVCDPSYPGVCIPPGPPDLDCGAVPHRDFRVLAPDPHGFDGNRDGVGCVS